MHKINVLFLSIYDPLKGSSGPGNHLRYLSKELTTKGCQVHILIYSSETKTIRLNGITYHYFKRPIKILGNLASSLFSIGFINQIIKRYEINIIHGHSPSSFAFSLLSRHRVPFIVTLHGTSFGELYTFFKVPIKNLTVGLFRDAFFVQPLTGLITYIEYKFADHIIVVSKSIGREAKRYYRLPSKKISVISNGVNPVENLRLKKEKNGHTILYVGRLIWRKGVTYLIKAFSSIISKYPDSKLIIVGKGEQCNSLQKMATKNGLQNAVYFQGFVSEKKLHELYIAADIYIQPSLYEPQGMAILEAMSLEKIVVSTRTGGIPEVISNNVDGLLVEPGNSKEIADAVNYIFSNPNLKNLGLKARLKVETSYTWNKIAEKTYEVYLKLLTDDFSSYGL